MMRRSVTIWALCSVIGAAVIALPDSGPRLFSFSRAHGPSAVDAIGILFLIAGWLVFLAAVWRRRDRVVRYAGTTAFATGVFAFGLGTGLLVASVGADFPGWWVVGAVVLLGVQLLVAYVASRSSSGRNPERR